MSDEQLENELDLSDEYEEICSDEVDRVVESLEQLAESVSSENIRVMLDETSQNVYELVYEEEAESDDSESDDIESDDIESDDIESDDSSEDLVEIDELLSDDDELAAEAA